MAGDSTRYTIPVVQVRLSITTLLERETHPFFIAYLHLRSLAGRRGALSGLQPNWPELGTVLEVPGAPPGKPYLRPFWKGTRQANQEWLNKNLAGSFAPSSIRGTPQEVIEVDAAGRFNLKDDHWRRAFELLLLGKKMPTLALAGFLFRDRAVIADDLPPTETLVGLFRQQYGYRQPGDDEEFDYLYDNSWRGAPQAWLEPFDPSEPDV